MAACTATPQVTASSTLMLLLVLAIEEIGHELDNTGDTSEPTEDNLGNIGFVDIAEHLFNGVKGLTIEGIRVDPPKMILGTLDLSILESQGTF